jgi:UDP-glucuronate 4-epimerase
MKILVTGAAGFIGSNLVKTLSQEGHQLKAIDSFTDYYSVELKKFRAQELLDQNGIEVANLELSDILQVNELFKANNFDAVVHLAAQPGVRLQINENFKYVRDNLVGFSNLAIESSLMGVKNFLYASSSSVYGNTNEQTFSENQLNLQPISFYGATKLSNEKMAYALSKSSATRFRGLRFFTVYGPGGRPDMAYFRLINSALNSADFKLYGNGDKKRDFTYIDDVVMCVSKLTAELDSRPEGFADVVNVGGGKPASMSQLIELVAKNCGTAPNVLEEENYFGDVNSTNASVEYLNSLINHGKFINLETGVKNTVDWALKLEDISSLARWTKESK